MIPSPPSPSRIVLLLALYGLLLTVVVCLLDQQQFTALFREGAPVEALTTPLWIMLAAWCLDPTQTPSRGTIACGMLALLAAMREADWQHHEATNMSMFKFKFYLQPNVALPEKLLAGTISILAIAVILWTLTLGLRHLLRERAQVLRPAWAQVAALGFMMLLGVKALDRVINTLADVTGYRIGGLAGRLIGGYEEGFEMALPLVFAVALWWYRRERALGAPRAQA